MAAAGGYLTLVWILNPCHVKKAHDKGFDFRRHGSYRHASHTEASGSGCEGNMYRYPRARPFSAAGRGDRQSRLRVHTPQRHTTFEDRVRPHLQSRLAVVYAPRPVAAGNDPANQHPGIDTHLGLSTPQQSTAAVRLVGRHLPNAQRHIVARTASRRQLLLDSERSQALGRGAAPRLHTPVRRRRTSGTHIQHLWHGRPDRRRTRGNEHHTSCARQQRHQD